MKIVRETLPKMQCGFCATFHNTDSDDRFSNGDRYCPAVKKTVIDKDAICKGFVLNKFFWCVQSGYWLDIPVCMARQEKESEGCGRCKQGEMVYNYLAVTGKGEKTECAES